MLGPAPLQPAAWGLLGGTPLLPGKSALAIELELLRLTPAERARREQQLSEDTPELQISGEWQNTWQQRESERQQLEARLAAGAATPGGPQAATPYTPGCRPQ